MRTAYVTRFCWVVFVAALMVAVWSGAAMARPAPASFADLVEELTPAVVNISTTQKIKEQRFSFPFMVPDIPGSPFEEFNHFFDQFRGASPHTIEREVYSLGSGFIVSPEGYVVTNNHVIAEADKITVILSDERNLPARIIGRDTKTDLALLKIESEESFPFLRFGDSDRVRVGDWVLAIGNPFGLGGTVTAGIVSARARNINAGPFDDFIQTDAAINRGNSGGPLFNMEGEVIGVSTAIFSPNGGNVGIGFALPATLAEPIVNQLKEYGRPRRGWLGVKIQTVTKEIAESLSLEQKTGALVVEVAEGSPAERAGLRVGDVITAFNGKVITDMQKLPRIVADTPIGSRAKVSIWRNGRSKNVVVKLGELEAEAATEEEAAEKSEERAPGSTTILGMDLLTVNDTVRRRYNLENEAQGLLIAGVEQSSAAFRQGLRRGDFILRVNEVPVETVEDAAREINASREAGRSHILLRLRRQNTVIFMTVPLGEAGE